MNIYNNSVDFKKMKVSDRLLDQVANTYEASFPEEERRDFALVRQLLADEPAFSAYVLIHDAQYIGFLTAWRFDRFAYIEHFAVEPSARNGGFGARAMQQFLEKEPVVVLEVEMPSDELSRRRIGFYERLGFVLDTHPYFQPPYRPNGQKFEMRLMSTVPIDLALTFDEVCTTLHQRVYPQFGG